MTIWCPDRAISHFICSAVWNLVLSHRIVVAQFCCFTVSEFCCCALSLFRTFVVLYFRCFVLSLFVLSLFRSFALSLLRTFVFSQNRCFAYSLFRTFVVSYLSCFVRSLFWNNYYEYIIMNSGHVDFRYIIDWHRMIPINISSLIMHKGDESSVNQRHYK